VSFCSAQFCSALPHGIGGKRAFNSPETGDLRDLIGNNTSIDSESAIRFEIRSIRCLLSN
jgi:hypothetical protein